MYIYISILECASGFTSLAISEDGNCLFNSMSMLIQGNE